MSTVIAEREITVDRDGREEPGRVRIYAPENEGDHWRCAFEISWPGHERRRRMGGQDAYQALLLALEAIVVEIEAAEDFKSGRLRRFGEPLSDCREFLPRWLGSEEPGWRVG
jgi:hypothetical protein